jgi:hypothetical protein
VQVTNDFSLNSFLCPLKASTLWKKGSAMFARNYNSFNVDSSSTVILVCVNLLLGWENGEEKKRLDFQLNFIKSTISLNLCFFMEAQ